MTDDQTLDLANTRKDLLEKLDLLIAPEHYLNDSNKTSSDTTVLSGHLQKIRQIIPFDALGFMVPDADGIDFELTHWWPSETANKPLSDVIDIHIEGGTFSLALQQNRPIVTYPSASNQGSSVLHILTARHKIVGMFVGIAEYADQSLDEFSLKLLSIILSHCAHNLESNALTRKIRDYNNSLESTIEKRTIEMRRAKDEAEIANQAKSQFLSTMSHELRTPLTAVIGYAETIAESLAKPKTAICDLDEMSRQATIIERSAKHLLQIINDILDISKIESGKIEVEIIEFSPREVIDEIAGIFSLLAKEKNLQFNINYHFPFPKKITSDPTRLKQILLNLCANGLKFTNQGAISIDIHFVESHQRLEFKVKDDGIGIPLDKQQLVFDCFQQADSSTSRRYGGTGLGLFISKKLSKMLGGDLSLSSAPPNGCQFTLAIASGNVAAVDLATNLEQLQTDHHPAAAPIAADKLQGYIVLAEDSPANQELIGMYLRNIGLSYDLAENGEQAVELALEKSPDLILMDIQMPIMSGLEATEMLRSCGYARPIVALTANAFKEDTERYLSRGFSDVLAKPIIRPKFYSTLGKYLKPAPLNKLAESYEALSEPAIYAELVQRFINSLPETLDSLHRSYRKREWQPLAATAHILKGSGGSFGFDNITRSAKQLEAAIENRDSDATSRSIGELDDLVRTILHKSHS